MFSSLHNVFKIARFALFAESAVHEFGLGLVSRFLISFRLARRQADTIYIDIHVIDFQTG